MATRRKSYLIQDPYDTDAQQFIAAMFRYFGMRPICFYTDPKARHYGERAFPLLRSSSIEAAYDVDRRDLASFARQVQERYDIAAVIPYREDTVEVAAELYEHLGVPWNAPATVARFRDKHSLKSHLRDHVAAVRVPMSCVVRSVDELRDADLPRRFVLKPNNGYGNRHVSVCERDDIAGAIAQIDRHPKVTWIVEEFIGGDEYEVDGHVRPDGRVDVLAVLRYRRVEVNGYPTVYHSMVQVTTDEPEFETCEKYARRLIEASGLVASPFHMEVKIDECGPAMVDIGARLPSDGGGDMISRMHPGRPDVYSIAVHDYLGDNRFGRDEIDWTTYDSVRETFVFGISDRHGRIRSVHGCDRVEAMPEFVGWAVKPELGQPLVPTTDLRSAPYVVALRVPGTRDDASAAAERVRAAIGWDADASGLDSVKSLTADIARRSTRKAGWLAACARRRLA